MRKERAFEEDAELDARPLLILVEERFALFERLSEFPRKGRKVARLDAGSNALRGHEPVGREQPLCVLPQRVRLQKRLAVVEIARSEEIFELCLRGRVSADEFVEIALFRRDHRLELVHRRGGVEAVARLREGAEDVLRAHFREAGEALPEEALLFDGDDAVCETAVHHITFCRGRASPQALPGAPLCPPPRARKGRGRGRTRCCEG